MIIQKLPMQSATQLSTYTESCLIDTAAAGYDVKKDKNINILRKESIMKAVKLLLIVLLVSLVPVNALYAQREAGMITIGGVGMYDIQTNPMAFKDFQTNGLGFAGKIKYHLSKNTGIGLAYQQHGFGFDHSEFEYEVNMISEGELVARSQNGTWNLSAVLITLTQYSRDKDLPFDFFVELGLGYYMLDMEDLNFQFIHQGLTESDSVMTGESKSGFGASFSLGLEKVLFKHVSFVLGATFHMTAIKQEENEMLETFNKSGGSVHFLSVTSGLNINF